MIAGGALQQAPPLPPLNRHRLPAPPAAAPCRPCSRSPASHPQEGGAAVQQQDLERAATGGCLPVAAGRLEERHRRAVAPAGANRRQWVQYGALAAGKYLGRRELSASTCFLHRRVAWLRACLPAGGGRICGCRAGAQPRPAGAPRVGDEGAYTAGGEQRAAAARAALVLQVCGGSCMQCRLGMHRKGKPAADAGPDGQEGSAGPSRLAFPPTPAAPLSAPSPQRARRGHAVPAPLPPAREQPRGGAH